MSQTSVLPNPPADRMPAAARGLLALLARIRFGSLAIELPDGQLWEAGRGQPAARIRLHNWRVFGAAMRSGDIGLAESFLAGDFSTPSLTELLEVLVGNRDTLERAVYGSPLGRLGYRLRHLINRNSRSGSRRNIHAHYDLGNAFYRLWLDPSMTYSSALFDERTAADDDLAAAQAAKYRRILDAARVKPGERLLEIGAGWGGFAETAVAQGVAVHGLTLSTEQLAHARERLAAIDGGALASFALQDYRDESVAARGAPPYDAIVSIEMFEAVGEPYWSAYFECLARNLKPGGRAVIQTITIADALFDRYRKGTDFIQQYVFPGGMLPSRGVFVGLAQRHGFEVCDAFAFGPDYARTLARWHRDFDAQVAQVRAQGFDERFIRLWKFYLSYCEAAFRHGNTDVLQFTLQKAAR